MHRKAFTLIELMIVIAIISIIAAIAIPNILEARLTKTSHRVIAKVSSAPEAGYEGNLLFFLDLELEGGKVYRKSIPYQDWKVVEVGQMWPILPAEGVER